jgi:ABC-type polysaccharide/polyol phosphate export permease
LSAVVEAGSGEVVQTVAPGIRASARVVRTEEGYDSGTRSTGLVDVAREVWGARELLHQLVLRDVKIRYKQAVMGFGWALLMPMLVVMAGFVVRFAMAHVSGQPLDASSLGGMAVKALPWAFFVGAIGFATTSLTSNMNLVTKIYFPREVLPLAAVFAQLFDTAIGATALALLLPFIGAKLSAALLWVPVLVLLTFLFTAGTCIFLACANLFFRDVKYIVQVLLTFGIFFTPVLFDAAMFGPKAGRLLMLNPMAPLLEGFRLTVVKGHNLLQPLVLEQGGKLVELWSPWFLVYSAAWAVLGTAAATLLFHRTQYLFAERL